MVGIRGDFIKYSATRRSCKLLYPSLRMRRRSPLLMLALLAAVLAVTLALVAILAAPSDHNGASSSSSASSSQATTSSGFDGAALIPSPLAPDFTLTDQYGRAVSL